MPCSIVAHSAGGLVARAAWLALGQAGATNLVRRIVTYGTPHQGSYGAVRLWSLDAASLTSVQYLAAARAVLRAIPAAGMRPRHSGGDRRHDDDLAGTV